MPSLSLATHLLGATRSAVLAALLPDMPAQMQADLLPLLRGNLDHIADIRAQTAQRERELDIKKNKKKH